MKRFAIHTLGCKVNQYETEAMEEAFLQAGYERATAEAPCDVYVINTCTVTRLTDAKCRQQIHRVKRQNPEAIVAVVGCYAQVAPEEMEAIEGVDIIIGTKGRGRLVQLVEEVAETGERRNVVTDLSEDRAYDELEISTEWSMTRAYVKIQEGCDMFCTYCIIPYARGHIASRSVDSIRAELERLAAQGFREVILTGIHIASYGREQGAQHPGLMEIIELAASIPALQRIRLSSIEPRWINAERLERMKATGKVCDHFHLSLQSGSDSVLRAMNRKYTTALYAEKVEAIRRVFPDAGLTTDVIAGFPGEGPEEWQETLDFCRRIGFSRIHIFPYSARPGTPAADFANQVDPAEKKRRAAELGALEVAQRHAFMDAHRGKNCEVLFESFSGDGSSMEGYSTNYMRVRAPRDAECINRVVPVRIQAREGDFLCGEVGYTD